MRTYTFIFLAFAALALSSCTKLGSSGPVTLTHCRLMSSLADEAGRTRPIAGAKVQVLAHKSSQWTSVADGLAGSAETDGEGYFTLTYRQEEGYTYYLKAEHPLYRYKDAEGLGRGGDLRELTYTLRPKGWAHLYVHNSRNDTVWHIEMTLGDGGASRSISPGNLVDTEESDGGSDGIAKIFVDRKGINIIDTFTVKVHYPVLDTSYASFTY